MLRRMLIVSILALAATGSVPAGAQVPAPEPDGGAAAPQPDGGAAGGAPAPEPDGAAGTTPKPDAAPSSAVGPRSPTSTNGSPQAPSSTASATTAPSARVPPPAPTSSSPRTARRAAPVSRAHRRARNRRRRDPKPAPAARTTARASGPAGTVALRHRAPARDSGAAPLRVGVSAPSHAAHDLTLAGLAVLSAALAGASVLTLISRLSGARRWR